MTVNTDNYIEQGAAVNEIAGQLNILSGGELDIESGGALQFGGVAMSGNVRAGSRVADATEEAANLYAIVTGLTAVTSFRYHILRAGANVGNSDEITTIAAGTVTITEKAVGPTFEFVADDVVYWIAVGS